jgi:MSHA pilin protein MshC
MLWLRPNIKQYQAQEGFTLLELIIVIVILGTLAVYALPRFTGTATYAEYGFQNRLISVLRNMQIRAMQDSRPNFCHRINFVTSSSQVAFGAPSGNFANGNQAATCGTSVDFSTPAYLRSSANEIAGSDVTMSALDGSSDISFIQFDSFGIPQTEASNCLNGCQIDFIGATEASVCIQSQGYVSAC